MLSPNNKDFFLRILHLEQLLGRSYTTSSLLHKISGSFILTALTMLLSMIGQIVLARILGVESYGLYIYVFSWIALLSIPSGLGLTNGAVRLVAQMKVTEDWSGLKGFLFISHVLPLLCALLIGSMVLAILSGFSLVPVGERVWTTWVIGSLIVLPLNALTSVQCGNLRGFKKAIESKLPGVVELIIFVPLIYFSATIFSGTSSALVALGIKAIALISTLLVSTILLRNCRPAELAQAIPRFDILKWGRITIPLLLVSGLSIVLKRTDILMLGAISDTTNAGIYAAVSRISNLSDLGIIAVNTVVNPLIAEYFVQGNFQSLQRVVTQSARIVFLSTLALTLLMIFFWEFVLGLFGDGFNIGRYSLFIIMSGQLFTSAIGPIGQILVMTKHEKASSLMLVGTVITNIGFNAMFIPLWGLTGAAIATTLSIVVWTIIFYFRIPKLIPIRLSIFG